jgi:hypothetical protein
MRSDEYRRAQVAMAELKGAVVSLLERSPVEQQMRRLAARSAYMAGTKATRVISRERYLPCSKARAWCSRMRRIVRGACA